MTGAPRILAIFAASGVVAGAFAHYVDALMANPFFLGMLSQAVVLLLTIWVAVGLASPSRRFGLKGRRWVAAALMLVFSQFAVNWVVFFGGGRPDYTDLTLAYGVMIGLGVIFALRILVGYWHPLAAASIVVISSINIFGQRIAPTRFLGSLVIPIWILAVVTLTGWWLVGRAHYTEPSSPSRSAKSL